MFITQSSVFSVAAAQSTIFTVIDDLATPRTVVLHNRSALVLTCQYQYSTDGGGSWTDLGSSFTLGVAGGGAEEDMLRITQAGRIRLLASGGASDDELSVLVVRTSLSTSSTFPLIVL